MNCLFEIKNELERWFLNTSCEHDVVIFLSLYLNSGTRQLVNVNLSTLRRRGKSKCLLQEDVNLKYMYHLPGLIKMAAQPSLKKA